MHEFLTPTDDAMHDPVSIVIALREHIADLPRTKATFKLPAIGDDHSINQAITARHHYSHGPSRFGWSDGAKLTWLAGTWKAPPWGAGCGSRAAPRYVNPRAPTGTQTVFADGYAQCACGAVIHPPTDTPAGGAYPMDTEHRECTSTERAAAREVMWERRRAIVANGYRLGLAQPDITPRYGARSDEALRGGLGSRGIPTSEHARSNGLLEIGETYLVLNREYGYTQAELEQVYDRGARWLQTCADRARDAHGGEDRLLDRFRRTTDEYGPDHTVTWWAHQSDAASPEPTT